MSTYLIKPVSVTQFELCKLGDDGMPAGSPYHYDTVKHRCSCPAGMYRGRCKHRTMITNWRKLPQPIGQAYDESEGKFIEIFEPTEGLVKLLKELEDGERVRTSNTSSGGEQVQSGDSEVYDPSPKG